MCVFVRTVMFGELASHRPVKAAQELPQETLSTPFITVGPFFCVC